MISVAALFFALVPPGQGTLAQGLTEMRRLSEAQKPDEALAVADRLLAPGSFAQWRERATATPGWKRTIVEAASPLFEAVGLSDLSSPERAAVHFARGVVLANAGKGADADAAFEQARSLAGPGELRFDSSYDLGWTALTEGEAQRAKIPELGGKPAAPSPQPAQPGQPGEPDPLQLARAAYTKALGRFVDCLKLDARDEDTRANAELAKKRLRELAEVQKKREEEKKKQEQQKKDQEKKDSDQKNQDKKDQDKQDPQKKDSSSEDKDKKKPDDQQQEEKPKDQKPEDPKDQESDKSKQEKKDAQPQQTKEEQLTKEEIMRILDTLKDREEEGKKILEQLRRARRAKVKRDW